MRMKKHCLPILFAAVLCASAPLLLTAAPVGETETDAAAALAAAPRGSITGVVLDDNRRAIQGAVVYIRTLNLGAVTAADGSFSLRGVPEGQYDVCVNYVGYEQICQNCDIRKEQPLHCEFLLHEGMAIGNVVVSGIVEGQRRALSIQKNNDGVSNIVAADQMSRFADANIGDAMKRQGVIWM